MVLRGPFFLAYVALIVIAFSVVPQTGIGWMWKVSLIISAAASAVGSFASWLIAGRGKTAHWLRSVEALEVTGLRVIAVLQPVYALFIAFILHPSYGYIFLNLGVGFFALGILLNMTWHKGRAQA